MKMFKGNTLDEVYKDILNELFESGDDVDDTLELLNVQFKLSDPMKSLITIRDISIDYLFGELLWYGASDNDVDFISNFSNFWKKISDDGVTSNSAYGYIIERKFGFNQLAHVIYQLKEHKHSRRAVININVPNENSIRTKDEPCTLSLQFYIRNNKLNLTVMMRSNDVYFGLPYDVVYFTTLQNYVAKKLNIELGEYTHFATSMHMYKRDVGKLKKSLSEKPKGYNLNRFDLFINQLHLTKEIRKSNNPKEKMYEVLGSYGIGVEFNEN